MCVNNKYLGCDYLWMIYLYEFYDCMGYMCNFKKEKKKKGKCKLIK